MAAEKTYFIYRSALQAAIQQATSTGSPRRIAAGTGWGDRDSDEARVVRGDLMGGTDVATVNPDGSVSAKLPLRIVEDTLVAAGTTLPPP